MRLTLFTSFVATSATLPILICGSASGLPMSGELEAGVDVQPSRDLRIFENGEKRPTTAAYLRSILEGKRLLNESTTILHSYTLFGRAKARFERYDINGKRDSISSVSGDDTFDGSGTINELYARHDHSPALSLSVGKKRVNWGTSFSVNPTDVLNPSKDPTDPLAQREGAWLGQVDFNFETHAHSLLVSPYVTHNDFGVPERAFRFRDESNAEQDQFMAAQRNYFLVADADVNFIFYYLNRYGDGLARRPALGLNFSRYFFKDYELHFEGFFARGSERKEQDQSKVHPELVVGTRYMFENESQATLEYFYNGPGHSRDDFEKIVQGLEQLRSLEKSGAPLTRKSEQPRAALGRFFARHYLLAGLQRYKLAEDWYFNLQIISNLQDSSGLFVPAVVWNATENVDVNVSLLSSYTVSRQSGVQTPSGDRYHESSLIPFQYRARAFVRWYF